VLNKVQVCLVVVMVVVMSGGEWLMSWQKRQSFPSTEPPEEGDADRLHVLYPTGLAGSWAVLLRRPAGWLTGPDEVGGGG
jgi:hypothetical protein